MTLEQFAGQRKCELLMFFKARFGRTWRQTVVRQTAMHPRTFSRWAGVPPISLYRQIHKLEKWARTIGFQSSLDSEMQEALKAYTEYRTAAEQSVAEALAKRKDPSLTSEGPDWSQLAMRLAEGMARMRRQNDAPG